MNNRFLKYEFNVPKSKTIRLIINTDAKNEADDQFAIVHALLTPKISVEGIIAAHFGTWHSNHSMLDSYDEVKKVVSIMGLEKDVDVYHGSDKPLVDECTPQVSEGAEFIVREAMKEDSRPLYVAFLGPLTDMAAAYLMNPEIEGRVNVIWIGGREWPTGGVELNLSNDINAANVVFKSKLNLWQVPRNVYCTMRVTLAELQDKVRPYGEIGEYLFKQMVEFNDAFGECEWPLGESWALGDSPAIGLLLDPHEYCYDYLPAPRITKDMYYVHEQNNRAIRVYNKIDARFILEDFFSKMKLVYQKN